MNESQPFVFAGGYDGTIVSSPILPDQELQLCENFSGSISSQINKITPYDKFFYVAGNPHYIMYDTFNGYKDHKISGHQTNVTDIVCVTMFEKAKEEANKSTNKNSNKKATEQESKKKKLEFSYLFSCSEDGSWMLKKFQKEFIQMDKCVLEKRVGTTSSINSIQVNLPYLFSANERGEIELYSVYDEPKLIGYIKISELPIRSIALSKDNELLIAACHDGNICIFQINYNNKKQIFIEKIKFKAHDNAILRCIISPDQKTFVTTSADSTAKLWSFSNYTLLYTLADSKTKKWVWDASYTKDSKYVVTGGSDSVIRTWQVSDGKLIFSRELKTNGITALTVFYK